MNKHLLLSLVFLFGCSKDIIVPANSGNKIIGNYQLVHKTSVEQAEFSVWDALSSTNVTGRTNVTGKKMELVFIGRSSDGLMLCETWESRNLGPDQNNLKQQAKNLLKKVGSDPNCHRKMSVDLPTNRHTLHYIQDENLSGAVVYMVLSANSFSKAIAFAFLEDIQALFFEELKKEFGLQTDLRSQIETR